MALPEPDDRELSAELRADRDRLARRLVREYARVQGHLPAGHPLADIDTDAPLGLEALVYTRHDGLGRLVGIDHGVQVALHVPAWHQFYVVPPDGESVVVLDVADDGTLAPVAAYRGGRLLAAAPAPATAASDEVVRHQVDAQLEDLAGHLPAPIAAEVRADIVAGDVDFPANLADCTHAGRLAFLTPGRRRAYSLEHDRDGHTIARVTTLDPDGTAASATFRDGDCIAGQVGRIVLED